VSASNQYSEYSGIHESVNLQSVKRCSK